MGLDLAELILEVEERYAVELEGDDCANIRTFGDLIDMVKQKIDKPLDLSIEETGYEIILQSLLAKLRLRLPDNVEVNEDTQLRKLKRYVKPYDIWTFLRLRFPESPSWLHHNDERCCLGCLGFLAVGLVIISTIFDYFAQGLQVLLTASTIWFGIVFALWFWIFGRPSRQTVGFVAKAIAERRQKLLKVRECSVDDIENELRDYMSKAFALKPETIRQESDLVKDLGLG